MKTLEWNNVDKSDWADGPWKQEPDKKQFIDSETGYPCLIHRNRGGSLCGYVGLSEGHPYFQKDYSDIENIDVHGGLTFSKFCHPSKSPEMGICHLVEEGENDRVWWLGFDCAHSTDVSPKYLKDGTEEYGSYKYIDYVEQEIKSLATQLKSIEKA